MKFDGVSTEEFFLKIFKFVVLFVMALTVLVTAGGLLYAGYQYLQSPKEPAPAKTAPAQSVNVDDFINQLKPKAAPVQKQEEEKSEEEAPAPEKPQALKYLDESKQVFNCTKESNTKAGRDAPNDRLQDNLREYFTSNAARRDRGDAWVVDAAKFSCAILLNTEVISLRKKNPNLEVLGTSLQFHIQKWDEIKKEIAQFDRDEQRRIDSEIRDEEIRVMLAKAKGFTALVAAGIAFAIFMALALYLIISAIESNLRNINHSIQSLNKKSGDVVNEHSNETLHN
jgi:hypothetical protein